MDALWLILAAVLFLAYANGANDNFKGVATLRGCGALGHRYALAWATVTTLAGSLTAAFFATQLAKVFSGKGLVPEALTAAPEFMLAVMIGAALTVFLAARLGIPISTTHALTGGLVGAGFTAAGSKLNLAALGGNYFYPLAFSPLIAVALAALLHLALHHTRKGLGISKQACLCVGERRLATLPAGTSPAMALASLDVVVDDVENCEIKAIELYQGRMLGIGLQKIVDTMHVLSAGAVGFSRGLNDTPKIVGVAMPASILDLQWITFAAAAAMAVGGLLQSHRVARTMAEDITVMNHGQGLAANLVTSILVLFASKWGLPVSTTHVSCGAIFGIGGVNRQANWAVVRGIIYAWVLTLPCAAAIAAAAYPLL